MTDEIKRLDEVASKYFGTLSKLSVAIGRSRQFLNSYKAGAKLGRTILEELENKAGINPDYIIKGEGEPILNPSIVNGHHKILPIDSHELMDIYEVLVHDIPRNVKLLGAASISDFPYSVKHIALGLKLNKASIKAIRVHDGIPDAYVYPEDVIIYDSQLEPQDYNQVLCIISNQINIRRYLELLDSKNHALVKLNSNDSDQISSSEVIILGIVKAVIQYR